MREIHILKRNTEIQRKRVKLAINHQIKYFGFKSLLFYPKNYKNYSGRFEDTTYDETPNDETYLYIPGLINDRVQSTGGLFDNLFVDELELITPWDHEIPRFTKIVVTTDQGIQKYVVGQFESENLSEGNINRTYILTPLVGTNEFISGNDELVEVTNSEYEDLLEDLDANPENTTAVSTDQEVDRKLKFKPLS